MLPYSICAILLLIHGKINLSKCFHLNPNMSSPYISYLLCCEYWQLSFMQHSNDTNLAYTLAAISNLLFENGISSTAGILGSSYSPFTSMGISLSVQQQLFVLLRGSLKRAENLKLKRLLASNHLAMAKFDLTVM